MFTVLDTGVSAKWTARISVDKKSAHAVCTIRRGYIKNVTEMPMPRSLYYHWLEIETIFLYKANGINKVVNESLYFVSLSYLCNGIVCVWLTAST